MALFSYIPDFRAKVNKKPAVRSVKFGDGYEQRLAYGLNRTAQIWDLAFNTRDTTEANAIDAFLQTCNGQDYFTWTPPDQASPLKFICREWNKEMISAGFFTITAKFEQVFDA